MKISVNRPSMRGGATDYGLGSVDRAGKRRVVEPEMVSGDAWFLKLHETTTPHQTKSQLLTYTFAKPISKPLEICRVLEQLSRSYFLPGVECSAYPYVSYIHRDKGRLEHNEEYGCRDWVSGKQVQPVVLPRQQYDVLLLQEAISHWMDDDSTLLPGTRKLILVRKSWTWSTLRAAEIALEKKLVAIMSAARPRTRDDVVALLNDSGLCIVEKGRRRLVVESNGQNFKLEGPYCDEQFANPEFIARFHERCESEYQKYHANPRWLAAELQSAQIKRFEALKSRLQRNLEKPALTGRLSAVGCLEALRELQGFAPLMAIAPDPPRRARRLEARDAAQQKIYRALVTALPRIFSNITARKQPAKKKKNEIEKIERLRDGLSRHNDGILEGLRKQAERADDGTRQAVRMARDIRERLEGVHYAFVQSLELVARNERALANIGERNSNGKSRSPNPPEPVSVETGPGANPEGRRTRGRGSPYDGYLVHLHAQRISEFRHHVAKCDQAAQEYLIREIKIE